MDHPIILDLADQTGRHLGRADSIFAEKMQRRLRRKFGVVLDRDVVLTRVLFFHEVYRYASAVLADCINPSADGYDHAANVQSDKFQSLLVKKFSEEDPDILNAIAGWAVYYEYLH